MDSSIVGSIIVALITGAFALIGTWVSARHTNEQVTNALKVSQAVTDAKLENLTLEVKKYSSAADRIPRLETRMDNLEHRIDKLEDK